MLVFLSLESDVSRLMSSSLLPLVPALIHIDNPIDMQQPEADPRNVIYRGPRSESCALRASRPPPHRTLVASSHPTDPNFMLQTS